jgi:hypothetical protein
MAFWEAKLGMGKAGWEPAAKKVAQHCLDQMKNWRMLADELKAAAQ